MDTATDRKFHPASEIFPLMEGEAFSQLVADIRANGQREPIVYVEATGEILDGRNRYRACRAAGIEPAVRSWEPTEGQTPVSFVVSLNLHRRHLSESQRAMVAGRIANMDRGYRSDLVPNDTKSSPAVSAEHAAGLLNVGRNIVFTAKRVLTKAVPEVVDAVEKGKVSVNIADQLARLEPDHQRAAIQERIKNPPSPGRPRRVEGLMPPRPAVAVRRGDADRLLAMLEGIAAHASKPSMQISFIDLRQQAEAALTVARQILAGPRGS